MLKFKGNVLTVSDEIREFSDKDKDGNKLATTSKHRITNITMIVKDGARQIPCVVKGFDLPSTFQIPKEGDAWETPEVVCFDRRFAKSSVPEISI